MSTSPKPEPTSGPKSSRRGLILVIAAFIAGALVFTLVSNKKSTKSASTTLPSIAVGATPDPSGAATRAPAEQQPVTASGDALAGFPEKGPDPAVGKKAPKLVGYGLDGKSVTIDPADGKPKVIAFIAHWCPHCQREVPLLTQWKKEGKLPAGIDVYAIATSTDKNGPNYPPSAWLTKVGWPYPAMADSSDAAAAKAYGLSGFPFFAVLRADGTVATRTSGEKTLDEAINMFNTATAA
jgi:thiol-disulfide isomerase/thioredoxin